jgi:glycosyltransferase involved in cell wall biosynthesis
MKVSIITVCKNASKTIVDTMASVLNQDYENIEHLIVDGNSTDNTEALVKSFRSPNIRFYSENDEGLYFAMNRGLNLCQGEIIGFLNADDVFYDEHCIKAIVNHFKTNNADIVYGNVVYTKQNDLNKVTREWVTKKFKKGSFLNGWHPAHPAFYVLKKVYNKDLYNTDFKIAADFDLMLRVMESREYKNRYLDKYLVKMREGGLSNSSWKAVLKGNMEIIKSFEMNGLEVSSFYTSKRLLKKFKQKYL